MYSNQLTKWRLMVNLNQQFALYKQFFNVNTGNAIKILDVVIKSDVGGA